MSPKVSVIIPNYNHARYLPQRIASVLEQSFQDLEVILMDDCSSDNSREVIARYAAQDARIRVVLNEQNSGSTFKQWNKGIALARGEYVWLAESDDYAHPELLATLVTRLDDHPRVGLAYCQSFSVDEENRPMPGLTWAPFYVDLDPDLWQHDFTTSGLALVRRFMTFRNIIPNASAVLLRRSTLAQVGPADESYKVLGDWLFWAKILAVSEVSFVARPLNYFRLHRNNVRTNTLRNGISLVEITQMMAIMRRYGEPAREFYEKAIDAFLALWLNAFVYQRIPLVRHRIIYRNMSALEPRFQSRLLRALRHFLLKNKLSGIRMLLGDRLLYPLARRLRY